MDELVNKIREDFLEKIETLSVAPKHRKEISTLSPGDQLEKLDELRERYCKYVKSKTRTLKKKEKTKKGKNFYNEGQILRDYLCLFDTTTFK